MDLTLTSKACDCDVNVSDDCFDCADVRKLHNSQAIAMIVFYCFMAVISSKLVGLSQQSRMWLMELITFP